MSPFWLIVIDQKAIDKGVFERLVHFVSLLELIPLG